MTSADNRREAVVESEAVADGMSPYATGGGGVVLEHRVVARYMAHMIASTTFSELKGRAIVRITCQEAAPVDDVIIHAGRSGEVSPSLRLAVASRRAPDLVPSDPKSQKLVTSFMRELRAQDGAREDGFEQRIGLVVAGPQQHAEQLKFLAALAEPHMDAEKFFAHLQIPKRFEQNLVTRLECLEKMVKAALRELTGSAPGRADVRSAVLELLKRLDVDCLNLEAPDTSDWDELANTLIKVSRDGTLESAMALLDRLETLAGQWVPRGADFNASLLRRHVHDLINTDAHRRTTRWARLTELEHIARHQVRTKITTGEGVTVSLDRQGLAGRLRAAIDPRYGLIVHGESGVGKSALVLGTLTQDAQGEPEQIQVVCLNLERLPIEPVSLLDVLDTPLRLALADLSAPRRFLVIDGADAALREHGHTFRYLIDEAREAEVAVIAVASDTGFETVRDTLREQLETAVPDFTIPPLEKAELDTLALRLPALARLLLQERSRKLLGRLVVIDLLMRGNATAPVLSDLDALRQVWEGLVRSGSTARELVMQRLAQRELSSDRGRAAAFLSTLNTDALDGLIEDGLLLRAESAFPTAVPVFAHDEIRRYAVARVLIDEGEPARVLAEYGAPRWAMSAARLACQGLLDDTSRSRSALTDLQTSFDQLVAEYGRRWADVPAEALLACRHPSGPLSDGWSRLRGEHWFGVHRLCRLIGQQQRGGVFVDLTAIEPIVALLLREERPWQLSRTIETFLRRWLVTLALYRIPAGHSLRVQLRAKRSLRTW